MQRVELARLHGVPIVQFVGQSLLFGLRGGDLLAHRVDFGSAQLALFDVVGVSRSILPGEPPPPVGKVLLFGQRVLALARRLLAQFILQLPRLAQLSLGVL